MKSNDTMRNAQVCKLMLCCILLLVASVSVSAFGLRPTMKQLDFAPDLVYDGQFVVTTNPEEYGKAKLVVTDELAPYISFLSDTVELSEETSVHYTLKLPEGLTPGQHVGKILIEETVDAEDGITAKIRLTYKIIVNVPVPEKHIVAHLDIKATGGVLDITTNVRNVGALDVQQVSPSVVISNPDGEVASVSMLPKALPVSTSETFTESVSSAGLKNGIYRATAAIAYDEGELEVAKDFAIGVPLASVTRKDTRFRAGEINEFTLDIRNEWNEALERVTASVAVSKDGARVATFAAAPVDLAPRETAGVKAFFDATALEAGTYDAVVTLTYPGGSAQDLFGIELFDQSKQGSSWPKGGLVVLLVINGLIAVYVVGRLLHRPQVQTPLQKYVQEARKRGLSAEDTRQRLLSAGWPREKVDETIGKVYNAKA